MNTLVSSENGYTVIRSGSLLIHVQELGEEEEHCDSCGHEFGKTPIAITLEQDGKRFDMQSLIAPGWRLVSSIENQAMCTMKDKGSEVFIPQTCEEYGEHDELIPFLMDPKGLMTTLHEMGHSWQMHRMTQAEEIECMQIRDRLAGKGPQFTSADSDLLLRTVYWPECNAWKFATLQRTHLNKEGFDIGQMLNKADIRLDIANALKTYRTTLKHLGVIFPTDNPLHRKQ